MGREPPQGAGILLGHPLRGLALLGGYAGFFLFRRCSNAAPMAAFLLSAGLGVPSGLCLLSSGAVSGRGAGVFAGDKLWTRGARRGVEFHRAGDCAGRQECHVANERMCAARAGEDCL